MTNKEIIDLIHKAIYQFMDEYENDNGEEPLSEKDELLLEVNKAICSKLRTSQRDYEMIKAMTFIKQYCNDIDECINCPMYDNCNRSEEITMFPSNWYIPEV